jgi:phage baseplate assembly protein W
MAKERKEYRYNPIDFKKDVAVGVQLPFGKNKGLFSLSYTTEQQAISNLKNLLLTRKGERPFQPQFGSDVYSLMFEQMDIDLPNKLSTQLGADIEFWLPYIVIDDIVVEPDFDRNFVSISLSFRVTEDGANQQIIMFIDSAGTTTLG